MGRSYTDFITVDARGHLTVEARGCVDLAQRFGTPLLVISEVQLRCNARSLQRAFMSRYARSEILFSNRANLNPAGSPVGIDHLRILREESAAPRRVAIGHSDSYLRLGHHEVVLQQGACVLPRLRATCLDDESIHLITTENPRRLLAGT